MMKFRIVLLSSTLAFTFGVTLRATPELVPHAHAILASYNGQMLPVEAVTGSTPKVRVNGELVSVGKHGPFVVEIGKEYAPGYVEFRDPTRVMRYVEVVTEDGFKLGGQGGFDGFAHRDTLVARETHDHCYAAIVYYNSARVGGITGIQFESLGQLKPGKKTELEFAVDARVASKKNRPGAAVVLLFSQGREIATSEAQYVESALYNARGHEGMVHDYVTQFRGADHPLEIVEKALPKFPADLDASKLPPSLTVTLHVSAAGRVDSVKVSPEVPNEVYANVIAAMRGWLFLPRLKKGVASPATVEVPITLKKSTATFAPLPHVFGEGAEEKR